MMIKDILERHGVYTDDLELELLRHFEKLRNEMLASLKLEQNMFLLEEEKAFVSWWENEASKMNTTVNKLSARVAFGAGWRIHAQQSMHVDGALEWVCEKCLPDAHDSKSCAHCGTPRRET